MNFPSFIVRSVSSKKKKAVPAEFAVPKIKRGLGRAPLQTHAETYSCFQWKSYQQTSIENKSPVF